MQSVSTHSNNHDDIVKEAETNERECIKQSHCKWKW